MNKGWGFINYRSSFVCTHATSARRFAARKIFRNKIKIKIKIFFYSTLFFVVTVVFVRLSCIVCIFVFKLLFAVLFSLQLRIGLSTQIHISGKEETRSIPEYLSSYGKNDLLVKFAIIQGYFHTLFYWAIWIRVISYMKLGAGIVKCLKKKNPFLKM